MGIGDIEGFSVTGSGVHTVRKGKRTIARYALTPLGKIKAEDGSIIGPQGEIIAALEDDAAGEMTKRELVNQTKMPESQVGFAVRKLVRVGYVREVTNE